MGCSACRIAERVVALEQLQEHDMTLRATDSDVKMSEMLQKIGSARSCHRKNTSSLH